MQSKSYIPRKSRMTYDFEWMEYLFELNSVIIADVCRFNQIVFVNENDIFL